MKTPKLIDELEPVVVEEPVVVVTDPFEPLYLELRRRGGDVLVDRIKSYLARSE